MWSRSPLPLQVMAAILVLQAPPGKGFIRALCCHNATSLDFGALPALFGPPLPPEGLWGYLVEARPANACHPVAAPPNSSSAFVALIRRHNCSFATKVLHAQRAGYRAAIVHNVNSQTLVSMVSEAGARAQVRIPSVFTTGGTAEILKRLQCSGTLTSVALAPEYFHLTWQAGSGTARASSRPCRIQLPGPCLQEVDLHACVLTCLLVLAAVASLLVDKSLFRGPKWWKGRKQPPRARAADQRGTSWARARYQECAICLEKYLEGDRLKVLSCSHAFHRQCIDLWHVTQAGTKTCPLCKRVVLVITCLRAASLWQEGTGANSPTPWSGKAKLNAGQPPPHLLSHQLPSRF